MVCRGSAAIAVMGLQVDLVERMETGESLSPSSAAGSSATSQGSKARSDGAVCCPQGERSALRLSSSEEGDGESADEPPQSAQYDELVEVITRALAELNLEWPAEKQSEPSKSKLDERFLRSKPLPPRRGLPFFPNLHSEVSRSWARPYSARLFSPSLTDYSNISGLNECGYRLSRAICPPVWHRLLKPRRYPPSRFVLHQHWWAEGIRQQVRLVLAYMLLKELDKGEEVKSDDIK